MKYLLVLIVVVVGLWLLLRPHRRASDKRSRASRGEATRMVQCAHCGVHLPEHDAVADTRGEHYCSDAHRLAGPR